MNATDLARWGVPPGDATRLCFQIIKRLINEAVPPATVRAQLLDVLHAPAEFTAHSHWGELAAMVVAATQPYVARTAPAPWRQWGANLEHSAVEQLRNACELPVAVAGALMPDAHPGYGLPIGGVLATAGAVIPYAVGVDIACRMRLTVFDWPADESFRERKPRERMTRALTEQTRFGAGATFQGELRREHAVMDRDWAVTEVTAALKDKAWAQLGTSGSGNHFVEFGEMEIRSPDLGVAPGTYVALLSHSGSRGPGALVADHYCKAAMAAHPELPRHLKQLAWLDLSSTLGQEYWAAMQLMGEYAAANHACIHRHIAAFLKAEVLLTVENHHNFAWKENHGGQEVVVHRKGATPAGPGVLGVIPGSMASPAYVVRGRGVDASLHSAAHGAGRVMSRAKAKEHLRWEDAKKLLKERNVTLLSAGLDELPRVYKDIDEVMAAQSDLVESLARFFPRIVKMADAGEKPED